MKINTLIYVICLILAFVGLIILIVDACYGDVETLNLGPMFIIETISSMTMFITLLLDNSDEKIGKILNKNIF